MGIFQDLTQRDHHYMVTPNGYRVLCRRNVVMRDGRIVSDRAVARRFDAALELEKIHELPPEIMEPTVQT